MSLFLRQRAANPHLGVPPIAGADGVDVDAVVALILDDHGACPSPKLQPTAKWLIRWV
jgi:hypothetical protein